MDNVLPVQLIGPLGLAYLVLLVCSFLKSLTNCTSPFYAPCGFEDRKCSSIINA